MKGRSRARAEKREMEFALAFALGSICSREVERGEVVAAAEREREIDRAVACLTAWDTSRNDVPVEFLREIMERKIRMMRSVRRSRGGGDEFTCQFPC